MGINIIKDIYLYCYIAITYHFPKILLEKIIKNIAYYTIICLSYVGNRIVE